MERDAQGAGGRVFVGDAPRASREPALHTEARDARGRVPTSVQLGKQASQSADTFSLRLHNIAQVGKFVLYL